MSSVAFSATRIGRASRPPSFDARVLAFWLPLLAACSQEIEQYCVDLQDDPSGPNHVQPYHVWVDDARREIWNTALETPTVAVIDADTHELNERLKVADFPLDRPVVVTDDQGVLWVGGGTQPALTRYDRDTKEHEAWFPLDGVSAMLPRPGGGVIVFGPEADGSHAVAVVGADGEMVTKLATPFTAGMVAHPDGVLLLSMAGDIRDVNDLSLLGNCPLPTEGKFGVVLPGGPAVVTTDTVIGWSDCAGGMTLWTLGIENKEVVPYGEGAMVLDRIGTDDPNLGIARYVDATGVTDRFVTEKNTGFGAVDPSTGVLWANSEGTDEIVAFDMDAGVRTTGVRLGTFLDGLAADPESHDTFIATGRLSDTVKRVVDGVIVAETHDIHWPYSPVIDPSRGAVWLFRQTDNVVLEADAETLVVRREIDLGFAPNPQLLFSTLVHDPARDLLYFAESSTDTLVQIDPEAGIEIQRWDLGGPLITDPDDVGELTAQVDPISGAVFLGRTNDGRLQRVLPPSEDIVTNWFDEDPANPTDRKIDSVHVHGDTDLVWFGEHGFDAATLERRTDRVLEVADVFFGYDGDWVVIDRDKQALQRVQSDGSVVDEVALIDETLNAMVTRMTDDRVRLWFAHAYDAKVCGYTVERVLDSE